MTQLFRAEKYDLGQMLSFSGVLCLWGVLEQCGLDGGGVDRWVWVSGSPLFR